MKHPPPMTSSTSGGNPSAPKQISLICRPFPSESTTQAAAPSPKSTHVVLSLNDGIFINTYQIYFLIHE